MQRLAFFMEDLSQLLRVMFDKSFRDQVLDRAEFGYHGFLHAKLVILTARIARWISQRPNRIMAWVKRIQYRIKRGEK